MTFLSDTRIESPVTKTVKYKGKEGVFVFWDSDEKQEYEIELARFIPLAVRSMVTGYSKRAKKGIWSNEVDDLRKTFDVTIGGNLVKSGPWKEIKYEIQAHGGKFTPVVYAFWDDEIIRLLFAGACCGPWIEISKEAHRTQDKEGVVIAGFTDEVSGEVHFKAPVFKLNAVKPETLSKALESKATLDQFFIDYAKAKADKSTHEEIETGVNQERDMDEINQELAEVDGDLLALGEELQVEGQNEAYPEGHDDIPF